MPLRLFKRPGSDIWSFAGTVGEKPNRRRLRGSTKTTSKAVAEQYINDLENKVWRGHFNGPEAILTFAQAASYYRALGKPDRFLNRIENYWKDTLVQSITPGAIHHSAIALYPGTSGATKNRQVIVPTIAVLNHAAKLGLCKSIAVERFPTEEKERRYVTKEWIEDFMEHAEPRAGALACFMFATGARISEALELRWRDVDMGGRSVLIRQTKVGNERRNHIPKRLLVALANLDGDRSPNERVFGLNSRQAARTGWANAIERAGIEPMSFHCCRHGFATALLRAGVDVTTVAKLGGWKTAALVLSTYGHANDDPTLTEKIFDTPQPRGGEKLQDVI